MAWQILYKLCYEDFESDIDLQGKYLLIKLKILQKYFFDLQYMTFNYQIFHFQNLAQGKFVRSFRKIKKKHVYT